jgi:hypothetical protein
MRFETVVYNDRDLQSVVCGLYAYYFAVHGLPQLAPTPWNFLTQDVNHNDAIIKNKTEESR